MDRQDSDSDTSTTYLVLVWNQGIHYDAYGEVNPRRKTEAYEWDADTNAWERLSSEYEDFGVTIDVTENGFKLDRDALSRINRLYEKDLLGKIQPVTVES